MEITFVNHYSGDSPKRKRLAHACDACRKRKKRCKHIAELDASEDQNDDPSEVNGQHEDVHSSNGIPDRRQSARISSIPSGATTNGASKDDKASRESSELRRARFVADLEPVATLLNRPPPAVGGSRRFNDDIGVWIDRNEWDSLVARASNDAATADASQRPHPSVVDPLINIYFDKIHPILPLLDEDDFQQTYKSGNIPEALTHAMCLVAAKDDKAKPLLRLADSTTAVSTRRFCTALHNSITRIIRSSLPTDKVTSIRILALTSLHTQGPEGAAEASLFLTQAMHYAQTLGIHLGAQANAPATKTAETKRLFWCLWALDRSNSALNGRPIMMSDIDIAIAPIEPRESGFPAFEAWLRIAQLLNKVIDFYRPTSDLSATGWEGDYPGLEEIIDDADGWHLSSSLLATIHLFYLSVGILSHRTRGFREIPRGISSSIRQRLCAIEIARLMTAPSAPPLHPMPIIPYAVSLALSVSYQHLRQSQLEHQQADAREDFRTCCALLQTLTRTWFSADIMATLAKKVLDRLDRAPTLASYRIPRRFTQADGANGLPQSVVETDVIPPPTACAHLTDSVEDALANDTNGVAATAGVQQLASENLGAMDGEHAALNGVDLFNNMDDVFGTFMDPNAPLNLDDMTFFNQFTPFDWNADLSAPG